MGAGSKFRVVGGQRQLVDGPYRVKRPTARMLGRTGYSLEGAKILGEAELKCSFEKLDHQPILWVPAGFGDTHWMLLKFESMVEQWFHGLKPRIKVVTEPDPKLNRTQDYMSRLPFAEFGGWAPGGVGILGPALAAQVIAHGPGFDLLMYANRHVEAGHRIEEWLPSLEVNWDYRIIETDEDREFGNEFARKHGPFVLMTFFDTGYYPQTKRDFDDERMVTLARKLEEALAPCKIMLTGGFWDRPFHDKLAKMGFPGEVTSGTTTGAQMLALLRRAKAFVGHQAGNTMLAHHLGCPTVLLWSKMWREGHMIPHINDNMWTCWVKPDRIGSVYDAMEMGESDEAIIRSITRSVRMKGRKCG